MSRPTLASLREQRDGFWTERNELLVERRGLDEKVAALTAERDQLLKDLRAARLEINSLRVSHELINRFGPEERT